MGCFMTSPENKHVYGMRISCGCKSFFVPYRCSKVNPNACDYCRYRSAGEFFYKFYYRYNRCYDDWSNVYMWTLGTSIKYNYWYDGEKARHNLDEIISLWQKFNTSMKMRMRRKKDVIWDPLVYVVEAGSEGERLHIHLLHRGYIPHFVMWYYWRKQTNERSNVNFAPADSVGYLAKYVSKSLLRYSFLGKMYKVKMPEKEKKVCWDCSTHFYLDGFSVTKEECASIVVIDET